MAIAISESVKDNKIKETITQYKETNDGKVTKAQTDATTALGQVATKVSQTDYDTKTGDLTTKYTQVKQTTDSQATDIVDIKKTATSQASKINSISSDVDGTKQSIGDIKKTQESQSDKVNQITNDVNGTKQSITDIQTKDGKQDTRMGTIETSVSGVKSDFSTYKTDANGRIGTAQTTAQTAVDGLKNKVSQTDYNAKTGQLQTDLTTTTQTANQAKTDIVSIKQKDGDQDAKMNTIVSDANGTKQTVSDLQTEQGKQSGYISTLQQRADGFDATVTKVNNLAVGSRNLLLGTSNSTTLTYNGAGWGQNSIGNVSSAYGLNNQLVISFIIDLINTMSIPKFRFNFTNDWGSDNVTKPGCSLYSLDTVWTVKKISDTKYYMAAPFLVDFSTNGIPNYIKVILEPNKGNASGTLSQVKIESGTLPTDWTPAPEDGEQATAKAQLTADNASLAVGKLTSADGIITKAQADIQANANAITQKVSKTVYDQKTGDLTQAVSKAQSTADGAVSTVGNYQTSNNKRVGEAESKIEQNSKDITAKVSQTDYDQKTGKLSGDISKLQQTAKGFEATVTKVDNLAVGGRNLYLNSRVLADSIGGNGPVKATVEPFDSTTNMWHIVAAQGVGGWIGIYLPDYGKGKIPDNSDWSYSADIKGTGKVSGFGIEDSTKTPVKGNIGSTWSRISVTGHVNEPQNKTIIMYFDTTNSPLDVYIKLPKLETGNAPTDWAPASEDIETALAQVKVTADGVSSIVSNPTTGLSTRVQTAEGTLNKVNGTDIPALQNATFWQPYSSLNFNDYTKQGSFFFNTTTAKTNGPTTSNAWTYLIVEQGTSAKDRIKQTAWYDGVAGVKITYVRTLNSGIWSPWYANDNDSVTTISQTNSDITQEISDRKNGDSNTLQSSKDFTTSSITSYNRGIQSKFAQTSDAILAKVGATNLFPQRIT